jgi:hypothetical protein
LHLHRISATYKFRPNLAYVDLHSQKTKRRRGEEEGTFSDEAEEQEEQEAQPKKSKALGEAKEVMVSARKTGESKFPTGMSDMRRELLRNLRAEELESWVSLKYQDEVCHCPLESFPIVPNPSSDRFALPLRRLDGEDRHTSRMHFGHGWNVAPSL